MVQSGTIGTIFKKASNTNKIRGRAYDFLYLFITYTKRGIQSLMRRRKKSKYKYTTIGGKKYYFYSIRWIDPCGDSGHAEASEMKNLKPAVMVSQAYIFDKDKKHVWTFASYDTESAVFSDRNVFPRSIVLKMEKITL